MLDDPAKALPPAYNPAVFEKLAGLADQVHQQFDIKLPRLALASQAGYLFDELLKRVSNVNDPEEVEAALPLLEFMLKKQLQDAAASPGAGKRGAS
ncbi:hypothetical protein [Martelella mediterranea]|uniref:Uncharacterized protein n=1 Tax=Martelella mediterranea TaxID=293089 RepID=A0A4R3NTR3_9HYPH|nr:hypothetical protein [Martelella mediterranea]TCT41190.1 hypothetical protein EDC90_1007167 [Martelella mediterranea]